MRPIRLCPFAEVLAALFGCRVFPPPRRLVLSSARSKSSPTARSSLRWSVRDLVKAAETVSRPHLTSSASQIISLAGCLRDRRGCQGRQRRRVGGRTSASSCCCGLDLLMDFVRKNCVIRSLLLRLRSSLIPSLSSFSCLLSRRSMSTSSSGAVGHAGWMPQEVKRVSLAVNKSP